jgi:Zn-dependent metalloprotease
MQNFFKPVLLTATVFCFSFSSFGQNVPNSKNESTAMISIPVKEGSFAANLRTFGLSRAQAEQQLTKWLGLSDQYVFRKISETTDKLGFTHARYQEYFQDIPVNDGMAVLHFRDGKLTSVNGRITMVGEGVNLTPALTAEDAGEIAQKELHVVSLLNSYVPKLVIAYNTAKREDRLCWKQRIDGRTAAKRVVMYNVLINAASGAVIQKATLIADADVQATAKTLYNGTQTITTDSYSGGYRLRDNARSIETYDAGGFSPNNGSPLFDDPYDYSNATTTWDKVPTLMSMTLQAADSGFLSGIGTSSILASYLGNPAASNYLLTLNPLYAVNGAGSLPVTVNKLYINLDNPPSMGGYMKMQVQNNQINIVDQIDFDISNLNAGTHSWDDMLGNSGSYTVSLEKNPALDAHWGIERTYQFYHEIFNRNSYDDNGSVIRNYINGLFSMSFSQDNAEAIPYPYNCMVYGLGDGELMGPVVSLDVLGHEFTHLVTGSTADLNYYGESGALNESFSDIMGTCIEFFTKGDDANWNIGEGVMLEAPGIFRSMADPKVTAGTVNPAQPDTYQGQYWASTANPSQANDEGGVHRNSGVGNKWFYLLTMGGSGTNDVPHFYNVTGIGIEKAEQIAYRTLTDYLTPSSLYIDAYNASLLAAADLYDSTSQEYTSVKQAWYAVGIGDSAVAPVGIRETKYAENSLKIYPNPNHGDFIIQNGWNGTINAAIFTITGIKVKMFSLKQGRNAIHIAGLGKGIYLLKFNVGNKGFTRKLILD